MVYKIIQQQQERQKDYLKSVDICMSSIKYEHKNFLIELKEYFEENLKKLRSIVQFFPSVWIVQLERDIVELNKLIGRYE